MSRQALVAGPLAAGTLVGLAAEGAAVQQTPKTYYLALGDSIAYGVQPDKVDRGLPPSGYRTGYVDVFAARLRPLSPKIRVVNCPSRPGRPDHATLFGNDVAPVAEACKGDFACIERRAPRAIAQFSSRLAGILRRLRAAAPNAEIIVTGTWNFNADDLKRTDPLFRSINAFMARAAASADARFAATFPAFNPQGSVARERARICSLTFICSRDDPHPTDAGYRAIAAAVWKASRY
jgi:lysophospholipase L1-like esterase